jgi:hypothetical protein
LICSVHTDELDLERLDHGKVRQYAVNFPVALKQQVVEAVAASTSHSGVGRHQRGTTIGAQSIDGY